MKVMLTGGAGYIASHTCVELLNAGHQVVSYDNYCNSNPAVFDRIERISGMRPHVVEGDIRDTDKLSSVLETQRCDAVIHFAGLKAVGESVEKPLAYYDNNVGGSVSLLKAMKSTGTNIILFSSSATVYGVPQTLPLTEQHSLSATNPYGQTKLMIENILRDTACAWADLRVGILRYFNPVGAHESGLIGEDPKGVPNNLMPFVAQVAVGLREHLNVWGNDYPTPDGTGVRDYIHVVDLANGHVKALESLWRNRQSLTVNLGTGRGYSVLDLVRAFEQASGKPIPLKMAGRRSGDVACFYADVSLAKELLGWQAEHDLAKMCEDTWNWQSKNPQGYLEG